MGICDVCRGKVAFVSVKSLLTYRSPARDGAPGVIRWGELAVNPFLNAD